MEEHEKRTVLLVGLAAGTLMGAGLGVLFAPESGKRTREHIQRLRRHAVEKAEDSQGNVRDSLDGVLEGICGVTRERLEWGKEDCQGKGRGAGKRNRQDS